MSKEECLKLHKAVLQEKRSIFIFDEFSGEAFTYISNTKNLILGPRCIMSAFTENINIPSGLNCIMNFSMRTLIICCSALPIETKKKIKNLVSYMGGRYEDSLKDCVSHLVTTTVKSLKYEEAAKQNLNIVHPDWVFKCWERSQKSNITATDESFKLYKIPIFYNLCITSTGLLGRDRTKIKNHVEDNGGKYIGAFKSESIDILILDRNKTENEKFIAAIRFKKECLTPQWIYDSVIEGYALNVETYKVNGLLKASTPTKNRNQSLPSFNPNCSNLSDISRIGSIPLCPSSVNIDETQLSARGSTSCVPLSSYKKSLNRLNVELAKRAGNVLDGYNVFLSGFNCDEHNLLSKILVIAGAIRYNEISDQISHVLVGKEEPLIIQELKTKIVDPFFLNIDWLIRSLESKQPANEAEYFVDKKKDIPVPSELPSPSSKKIIKSLSSTFRKPNIPISARNLNFDQKEQSVIQKNDDNLVDHYLVQQDVKTIPFLQKINACKIRSGKDTIMLEHDESSFDLFLEKKIIYIHGYSSEEENITVMDDCEKYGATLVDRYYTDVVDYVISPSEGLVDFKIHLKQYHHHVTDLWLEESIHENCCLDVSYFYQPFQKLAFEEQPLKNELFVVSNYKGREREFLCALIHNLGGTPLDMLKRNDFPTLISRNDDGKKYEAAIIWNLPVLSSQWLLECCKKQKRVDETEYLVGASKTSQRNELSILSALEPKISKINPERNILENCKKIVTEPSSRNSITPKTPVACTQDEDDMIISKVCSDMPTPQREITKKVLLEINYKLSPKTRRLRKLLNTPTHVRDAFEPSSPAPDLPDCMKYPPINYAIRPDASPENQWFHKRKLEALDQQYVVVSKEKKSKLRNVEETPPFAHRRYDFLKDMIGEDFNSPDPRISTQSILNQTSPVKKQTELNYDDDERVLAPPSKEEAEVMDRLNAIINKTPKNQSSFHNELMTHLMKDNGPCRRISETNTEDLIVGYLDPDDAAERNKTSILKMSSTSSPIFVLTNVDTQLKEQILANIDLLGGELQMNELFTRSATHVICTVPHRGEKFLSAVSAGFYVLHSDYIAKCIEHGFFLKEDAYEFGNPEATAYVENSGTKDEELLRAPYRWRKKISQDKKYKNGAFQGFRAIFYTSKSKLPQFSNIIKMGGGEVFDMEPPYNSSSIEKARLTHCFVDNNRRLASKEHNLLEKNLIAITNISYLHQHLFSEIDVNINNYLISKR
ncbi:unnamed protein product [Diamesa serratosioi]